MDGQKEDEEAGRLPPTSPPKTPPDGNRQDPTPFLSSSPPVPQPRHNRARSFGAVDEQPDLGLFRVNIERAGTDRPKTAGPKDKENDHLDVNIPQFSLGSPQFTPQGTPFLHASFNASSNFQLGSVWAERGSITPSGLHSDFNWIPPDHPPMPADAAQRAYASPPVTPQIITPEDVTRGTVEEPSYFTTTTTPRPVDITPEIFNELSFPPESEDPRIVRYDPTTNEIIAATAPRIIAQITSATFLDYQLLSDFFLTYRLFLSPVDLVEYLSCRLRWAISRDDDVGRVVRVRTFVAIRHWLLNYFPDDFVPSLSLREFFAQRLNDLAKFVGKNGSPSDMKIIGEIKRCWRRTCALYWDPQHQRQSSIAESIESNITPGGPPGERRDIQTAQTYQQPQQDVQFNEEDIMPDFKGKGPENTSNSWPKRKRKPRTALSAAMMEPPTDGALSLPDVTIPLPPPQISNSSLALPKSSSSTVGPNGFRVGSSGMGGGLLRVDSELSARVTTRSIPSPLGSNFRFPLPSGESLSRQGTPGSAYPSSQALSRKMKQNGHKRSGSFSDAMRDNRQPLPLQKSIARSTHLLMAFPYPGSLVRGNVAPPTAAFVDVLTPNTHGEVSMPKSKQGASTLHVHNGSTGKGMKKLFVNMKKALSGKGQPETGPNRVVSPVARHSSPLLSTVPDTIFARRMASKSGPHGKKPEKVMTQRIDLLGAGAAEAFQKALREDGKNFDDPMGAVMEGTSQVFGSVYMPSVVSSPRSYSLISSQAPNSDNPSTSQVQGMPQRKRPESSPDSIATSQNYERSTMEDLTIPDTSIMGGSEMDGTTPKRGSFSEQEELQRTPRATKTPSIQMRDGLRDGATSKLGHHQNRSIAESFLSKYDTRSMRSAGTFHRRFSDGTSEYVDYRSDLDSPEPFERPPARALRRRPGGNLKNTSNVADLSEVIDTRRRAGSLDTLSLAESLSSLGFVTSQRVMSPTPLPGMDEEVDEGHNIIAPNLLSLGAVAGPSHNITPSPEPVTESEMDDRTDDDDDSERGRCTPNLDKLSFEAGVAQLALLPDNSSDDGGVDVALLKLQGLYKPKSPVKASPMKDFFERTFLHEQPKREDPIPERAEDEIDAHLRIRRRYKQVLENHALATPPVMNSEQSSYFGASVRNESNSSQSILEPGLTVDVRNRRRGFSESSVAPYRNHSPSFTSILSRADFAGVNEPITNRNASGKGREELRDDVSELSSEISFEMLDSNTSGDGTRTSGIGSSTGIFAELGIPSHPLRHPPSPPTSSPRGFHLPIDDELDMLPPPPATPTQSAPPPTSTTSRHATPKEKKAKRKEEKEAARKSASRKSAASSKSKSTPPQNAPPLPTAPEPIPNEHTAIHLPFILAYDSELLAKQFALIEKDALAEVDWKELVELKWKHAAYKVNDWVEFLSNSEVRGVEVVIARFNLVCPNKASLVFCSTNVSPRFTNGPSPKSSSPPTSTNALPQSPN